MEQDLRIIIEHLQTQRNDANNITCNFMLENSKLKLLVDELNKRIKELENGRQEQGCLQEGQFSEGIEPSGQRQSSKEDKHSKSKIKR